MLNMPYTFALGFFIVPYGCWSVGVIVKGGGFVVGSVIIRFVASYFCF